MTKYNIHYEHRNSSGGTTKSDHYIIKADNEMEACKKFYKTHDESYTITKIEQI